jgi:hypothetical protein
MRSTISEVALKSIAGGPMHCKASGTLEAQAGHKTLRLSGFWTDSGLKSDIFMAVKLHIALFWVTTPCSLKGCYFCFKDRDSIFSQYVVQLLKKLQAIYET